MRLTSTTSEAFAAIVSFDKITVSYVPLRSITNQEHVCLGKSNLHSRLSLECTVHCTSNHILSDFSPHVQASLRYSGVNSMSSQSSPQALDSPLLTVLWLSLNRCLETRFYPLQMSSPLCLSSRLATLFSSTQLTNPLSLPPVAQIILR